MPHFPQIRSELMIQRKKLGNTWIHRRVSSQKPILNKKLTLHKKQHHQIFPKTFGKIKLNFYLNKCCFKFGTEKRESSLNSSLFGGDTVLFFFLVAHFRTTIFLLKALTQCLLSASASKRLSFVRSWPSLPSNSSVMPQNPTSVANLKPFWLTGSFSKIAFVQTKPVPVLLFSTYKQTPIKTYLCLLFQQPGINSKK